MVGATIAENESQKTNRTHGSLYSFNGKSTTSPDQKGKEWFALIMEEERAVVNSNVHEGVIGL